MASAGDVLYKDGRYEEALLAYDEVVNSTASMHSSVVSEVLVKRCACYLKLLKYDEAKADAKRVLSADTTSMKAWTYLVDSLTGLNMLADAEREGLAGLGVNSAYLPLLQRMERVGRKRRGESEPPPVRYDVSHSHTHDHTSEEHSHSHDHTSEEHSHSHDHTSEEHSHSHGHTTEEHSHSHGHTTEEHSHSHGHTTEEDSHSHGHISEEGQTSEGYSHSHGHT